MSVRLDVSALDYTILAIYFAVVLGIGAVARLAIKTDIDFFLSGRSLRGAMADEAPQPFRPPGDMPSTGATDEEEANLARNANRFDIRRIIGALFVVYGVILVVTGVFGDTTVKNKADGINVNLWVGLAMLAFAIFMIAWALIRPTVAEPPETRGEGSGRIRRAPAT